MQLKFKCEPKKRAEYKQGDLIQDSDGDYFVIIYDNKDESYRLFSVLLNTIFTVSESSIDRLLDKHADTYSVSFIEHYPEDTFSIVVEQ